jgi:hypothetical protein
VINVGSTEEAARRAKEFWRGGACISSEEAIEKYGLELNQERLKIILAILPVFWLFLPILSLLPRMIKFLASLL